MEGAWWTDGNEWLYGKYEWKGGQKSEWINEGTNELKEPKIARSYYQTNAYMFESRKALCGQPTECLMPEWLNERTNGTTQWLTTECEQMIEWMHGCLNEKTDWWTNERINEWKNECMNEYMNAGNVYLIAWTTKCKILSPSTIFDMSNRKRPLQHFRLPM